MPTACALGTNAFPLTPAVGDVPKMLGFLTWNLDPILIELVPKFEFLSRSWGPLQIRYYGVMFALTIYTGFYVWQRQALKNRETPAFAEEFLWYGVVAIVAGARLGHCLFYEPKTFLADPIKILYFWQGGLASHGATVGLIVALWLFARKHKTTWFRVSDYLAPGIAIAAGGVRIGNFFNSEIVGRVTDVPWGVQFNRYCDTEMTASIVHLPTKFYRLAATVAEYFGDLHIPIASCEPRHPSQFYEFLMGVATYFVVMTVEKLDIRRAGSGLMGGVFMTMYFTCRLTVEFFKEYQTEELHSAAPVALVSDPSTWLGGLEEAIGVHPTMGQWLSIIPILIGVFMVIRALRQPRDLFAPPLSAAEVAPILAHARANPGQRAEPAVAVNKPKNKRKR